MTHNSDDDKDRDVTRQELAAEIVALETSELIRMHGEGLVGEHLASPHADSLCAWNDQAVAPLALNCGHPFGPELVMGHYLGERLERQKRWNEALALYRKALEIEPVGEELYRRAMLCHGALGRKADALAVYDRCCEVLARLLGVEPSGEMKLIRDSLEME